MTRILTYITVLLLTAGLILFPNDTADAVRNGLSLCCNIVIPSLFPFFVLSSFVTESGLSGKLSALFAPLMSKLFRISGIGACALILGLLGGYPIGASCVKSLYETKRCSKHEAEHLLGFCNNSGPSFILGAVGVGVFGNFRLGALLLLTHMLSALTVGILFSFSAPKQTRSIQEISISTPFAPALCTAVKQSLQSVLNICAFILFFGVLTEILHLFRLLPYGGVLGAACTGLFEITSGIAALKTATPNLHIAFILAATLLGFGGLSIHAQTLSLLSQTDLSVKKYFLGKSLHAGFSAVFSFLIAQVFLRTHSVFAVSATQSNLPGLAVLLISLLSFGVILLFSEKRAGN